MAAAIAAAVGGSIISAGANAASSLGTAAIQSNTARETNDKNLAFSNSVIDRGEKAYQDVGLPKFMYYAGNPAVSPNTMFHLGGQNFYEGSGVNTNLPILTTSPYAQYNHGGKPGPIANKGATRPGTTGMYNSTESGIAFESGGQLDRQGLGTGRYNNVPPPTLSYNSRDVQTSPKYFSDKGVNALPQTRSTGMNTTIANPNIMRGAGTQTSESSFRVISPRGPRW